MKICNLISNDNGVGLSRDVQLLKSIIKNCGHLPVVSKWNSKHTGTHDINFHIELVNPEWLKTSPINILIPNPEWYYPRWNQNLKSFTEVWCKSYHAVEIFQALKAKAIYTGWLSVDRNQPETIRKTKFLHLKGKSPLKGTMAVLQAWTKNPDFPELVVVTANPIKLKPLPKNITIMEGRFSEGEINQFMNECQFHICPSEAEGYGYYISEAMSCGGIVLTTDAPPMNEMVQPGIGITIPYQNKRQTNAGTRYFATPKDIAEAVRLALALSEKEREVISTASRNKWESMAYQGMKNIIMRINSYGG